MPPPPWKKARLSRMMSDHMNSPTHGGSLAVETGFPTSLVDLFVKNRHPMKKSSSKKNNWTTEIVESEPADSLCGSSVSSATSPNSPLSPRLHDQARGYFWSWWIFKVLFVVVLAMATKQFAIGITVSAFSLLLMELFGKYILKPWLYKRKSIENRNHSSSVETQSKEVQIEEDNCNADVVDLNVNMDINMNKETPTPNPKPNSDLRLPSSEIRAMKSILNSPRFHRRSASDDMGKTKDLHAYKSFNWTWFSEEEIKEGVKKEDVKKEDADNHSELDQISKPLDHDHVHDHVPVPNQIVHKSNSRKIKSRIKKFVKKLKSSKKERTDRRSDASCSALAAEFESFAASNKLNESNLQSIMCGYVRRHSGRISWR